MTKSQIIDIIISHKPYKRYCDKMANYSHLSDDLYQVFFLLMFEKPDSELIKLYESGYMESYCLSVIWRKAKEINRFMKVKGEDNPLLDHSSHSDVCSLNDATLSNYQELYNHKIDQDFDNVMDFINTDPRIKQSDVLVLFESLNGSVKSIAKESGTSYETIKKGRRKLINRIKENVKR